MNDECDSVDKSGKPSIHTTAIESVPEILLMLAADNESGIWNAAWERGKE
jgi:hypothetical protein